MPHALIAFAALLALAGCKGSQKLPEPERFPRIETLRHSQPKAVAFERLTAWAAQSYTAAPDTVEYQNAETGKLVLQGVYAVSREGVAVPFHYTLAADVWDENVRVTCSMGEPVRRPEDEWISGPFHGDMLQMKDFCTAQTAAALEAIDAGVGS